MSVNVQRSNPRFCSPDLLARISQQVLVDFLDLLDNLRNRSLRMPVLVDFLLVEGIYENEVY